jgi:hypothetical protein
MNIAEMAQKFVALLTMMPWFRVARLDVLENPNGIEISSRAARLLDHEQTAVSSGDFVHSADHSRLQYFRFAEQRPAPLLIGSTAPWLRLDKVRNSALPSSIVGIAPTEFLNHSLRTVLAE